MRVNRRTLASVCECVYVCDVCVGGGAPVSTCECDCVCDLYVGGLGMIVAGGSIVHSHQTAPTSVCECV